MNSSKNVESYDFKLKLLSPAFLGGAMDEKIQTNYGEAAYRRIGSDGDGFRIPSLRGILRFWYRSLHADLPVEKLKAEESKLFGGTEIGQGIRIIPLAQSKWLPKKIGSGGIEAGPAEVYLGYGPILWDRNEQGFTSHHKFLYRDVIPDDTEFCFRASGNSYQIDELKKILGIIHLFGGIGSRSRRGWGALSVMPNNLPENDSGESLHDWIRKAFHSICSISLTRNIPKYTAFSRHTQYMVFNPDQQNWKNIFQSFYNQFKKVRIWQRRSQVQPKFAKQDHNLARDQLRVREINDVPKRMGYGYPYKIRFRNGGTVEYKALKKKSGTEDVTILSRRGSPLLLSMSMTPRGRLFGIALYLKSRYWGDDSVLMGKKGQDKKTYKPISITDEAVQSFMEKGIYLEEGK
ncbi:MAG: type III-B CRISPR module RAMP protein Cmr1 [Candidatus Aminicenantes bacterium]|nr:type III-B CRISPR module RAMP protein Cmr1 [Candidatus Aminicenantes bacterium]